MNVDDPVDLALAKIRRRNEEAPVRPDGDDDERRPSQPRRDCVGQVVDIWRRSEPVEPARELHLNLGLLKTYPDGRCDRDGPEAHSKERQRGQQV